MILRANLVRNYTRNIVNINLYSSIHFVSNNKNSAVKFLKILKNNRTIIKKIILFVYTRCTHYLQPHSTLIIPSFNQINTI